MLIDRLRDRLASSGIELQDRTQVWAVLAVAAIVVAAVVWLYGSSRPDSVAVRSESTARASPEAAPSQASQASQSSEATIAVHVAGAVRRPGMVCLAKGARINDAVQLAGGALPGADLNAVNLATKVTDGQQIVVPRKGEIVAAMSGSGAAGAAQLPAGAAADGAAGAGGAGQAGAGQGATGGATVELNSATVAQFDSLPGIGPVLAQRIFDYRTQHGKFTKVEDLRQVEGIGPKKFEQLKSQVTCGP